MVDMLRRGFGIGKRLLGRVCVETFQSSLPRHATIDLNRVQGARSTRDVARVHNLARLHLLLHSLASKQIRDGIRVPDQPNNQSTNQPINQLEEKLHYR